MNNKDSDFKPVVVLFEGLQGSQKILFILTAIFVFLVPFPHISAGQEILYALMAGVFFYGVIKKEIKVSLNFPLVIPYVIFSVWAMVTVITALDKLGSLNAFYAHLIKYIILLLILVHTFNSREKLRLLGQIIMFSGALYSFFLMVYWYVWLANPFSSRLVEGLAALGGINTTGFMILFAMVLAVHFFFYEKGLLKNIAALSFVSTVSGLLLSQSRGTLLAMIAVFVVLFYRRRKLLFLGFVLVGCFVLATPLKERVVSSSEYTIRIGQYYYFSEIIRDHPVTGIGFALDTFLREKFLDRNEYMSRLPEKYRNPVHSYYRPHNMFFNVAVRTGLVGLALFLFVLFMPLKMCVQCIRDGDDFVRRWGVVGLASFVGFMSKAMFEPAFTHMKDMIFYTILAVIVIIWREKQNSSLPAKPL